MCITLTKEKILDTILHEIAHSLTPNHHHDHIWKRKAISIGCNGERCGGHKHHYEDGGEHIESIRKAKQSNYKYKLVCNNCGIETPQRSKPKRERSCIKCNPRKFDRRYILELKENK